MKSVRIALISAAFVFATAVAGQAGDFHHSRPGGGWGHGGGWSHGGGYHGGGYHGGGRGHGYNDHFRVGLYFGAPLWAPWYAPTRVIVAQPAPPVYYSAPASQYWYYCRSSETYYPYVSSCPEGWMQVVPQAPGMR